MEVLANRVLCCSIGGGLGKVFCLNPGKTRHFLRRNRSRLSITGKMMAKEKKLCADCVHRGAVDGKPGYAFCKLVDHWVSEGVGKRFDDCAFRVWSATFSVMDLIAEAKAARVPPTPLSFRPEQVAESMGLTD